MSSPRSMNMTSEQAITTALQEIRTPATREALKSADIVKFMAVQLEQTLKLVKDGGVPSLTTVGLTFTKKALETSKVVQKGTGGQGLKVANFVVDEMIQSFSLIQIANYTPGKALATIGATFVKKTALAINVGATTQQHKCLGAWVDLAGSAAVTAISIPSSATGIGVALLVVSAAQTIIAASKTYDACTAD